MQRTFYLKNKEEYDIWINAAQLEKKSISQFLKDCVSEHIENIKKKEKKRGLHSMEDLFGGH